MWLRNYYNILTALTLAADSLVTPTSPPSYNPPISVKLPTGRVVYTDFSEPQNYSTSASYSSRSLPFELGKQPLMLLTYENDLIQASYNLNSGIAVGSSDTPVNFNDYKLGSIISSGISLVSRNGVTKEATAYDPDTHHVSSKRTYTLNNNSAGNITVRELGLYIACGENLKYMALVYREVLPEPVILAPAESIIVSFNRDAEIYNYQPYPT